MMTVEELSRETDNHCDDEDIGKGLSMGAGTKLWEKAVEATMSASDWRAKAVELVSEAKGKQRVQ